MDKDIKFFLGTFLALVLTMVIAGFIAQLY